MAVNTTTIPAKSYVTIQYRADSSTESGLLGFLSPYTKDAAFAKRKVTQDHWAYGYGIETTIEEDESVTCKNVGSGTNQRFDAGVLFISNCFPRIVKNELLEGFEVAKSVKRCGWNGSGNVVWRIADPRGFELEISSANFARIIDCATIVNGVIQGKCVWGRNGKDNILLPEASDIYQEANTRTIQSKSTITLRDVKVGDKVKLLVRSQVSEAESEGQYLGKYYILVVGHEKKVIERYAFKKADGGYFCSSTPKVVEIVESIDQPLDKMVIAQEISAWLSEGNDINYQIDAVLVSPKSFKLADTTMFMEPTEHTGPWVLSKNCTWKTDIIICQSKGKYYVSALQNNWSSGKNISTSTIRQVSIDLVAKTIRHNIELVNVTNSGWWRSSYQQNKIIEINDQAEIDASTKYKVFFTVHGITGRMLSGVN